ncbi:MAG: metallophosphoesterase [Verrucomicrobia bacterium]|nr:metallophosphoesterase [Verrucomicrobiota bacterium]
MNSTNNNNSMTRRDALKKTILFSTSLLAVGQFGRLQAREAVTGFPDKGIHLLAIGDFGSGNVNQAIVAGQMAKFAKKLGTPLSGVLALGDNFYKQLTLERFAVHFEEMYSKEHLDCPFYACLGNHDYGPKYDSGQGRDKAQMQLDYAKDNPASRWKLPAKWYALELPDAKNPLVKIIFLDGNSIEGALTPQEKLDQQRFLEAELKIETRAPWTWMVSHYPMFSESTERGDNLRVIGQWGGHLKSHPISLYIAGHDHALQHLEVEGYKTSFVVSGAGGAGLYALKESTRGFAKMIYGFTHIHVTRDKVDLQFIDAKGNCLHSFSRTPDGKVEIASSSGS